MSEKHFSDLYMTAEDAVTEFREKCDGCTNLDTLNYARFELATLRQYIDTALGEIALELEKFYEE